MGLGYAILIWDRWGAGLVRVNARLHVEGLDLYGNPNNWFPCESIPDESTARLIHGLAELDFPFVEVIP